MQGNFFKSAAGWYETAATGAPKPLFDAGIAFARNTVWGFPAATGELTIDGNVRIQLTDGPASCAWSATYLTNN